MLGLATKREVEYLRVFLENTIKRVAELEEKVKDEGGGRAYTPLEARIKTAEEGIACLERDYIETNSKADRLAETIKVLTGKIHGASSARQGIAERLRDTRELYGKTIADLLRRITALEESGAETKKKPKKESIPETGDPRDGWRDRVVAVVDRAARKGKKQKDIVGILNRSKIATSRGRKWTKAALQSFIQTYRALLDRPTPREYREIVLPELLKLAKQGVTPEDIVIEMNGRKIRTLGGHLWNNQRVSGVVNWWLKREGRDKLEESSNTSNIV